MKTLHEAITLEEIAKVIKNIIEDKQKIVNFNLKHRGHVPHFDLRDYTDDRLIYGIKIIPIRKSFNQDYDNYNLGECFNYDTIIPKYRFFKFKDLYKTLCEVYDECEFETFNFRKIPIEYAIKDIFNVLSNNDKYYRTLYGKYSYRICIFLYSGPYTEDLNKLAIEFINRDIKEATIMSNYYRNGLLLGRRFTKEVKGVL